MHGGKCANTTSCSSSAAHGTACLSPRLDLGPQAALGSRVVSVSATEESLPGSEPSRTLLTGRGSRRRSQQSHLLQSLFGQLKVVGLQWALGMCAVRLHLTGCKGSEVATGKKRSIQQNTNVARGQSQRTSLYHIGNKNLDHSSDNGGQVVRDVLVIQVLIELRCKLDALEYEVAPSSQQLWE